MSRYRRPFDGCPRLVRVALGAATLGIAGLLAGLVAAPRQFFVAYLAAYAFAVTIAVGALLFLMICHAMRATWPVALRRLVEATVGTLPLLAILFVPLLFGLRSLYPWLRPESIADEHERQLVLHKLPYLNPSFFVARTALYFAIWIAAGALLRGWSLRSDLDPTRDPSAKLQTLSVAALPPVALAISFAAFDWLMSLTPAWFSTMFPVYVFAGGFLGAIAVLTLLTSASHRAELLPGLSSSHYHALGRLLLAFTVFWAYAAFFQFFLVWIANRPDEAIYYAARMRRPWKGPSVVLVFAQFVLPFLALLNYDLKRRRGPLTALAIWLIAAHYVDVHWLVAPALRPAGPPYHWLDVAALLAVGGVTVAYGAWRLRGHPIVPIHDPALARALAYESS